MSRPPRPDLTALPEDVVAYIEALEAALDARPDAAPAAEESEPAEAPTTFQVLTISRQGWAKRTPRHHYSRQRRGGMGVFDLETSEGDEPALLVVADESDDLLLFTDRGRAFRLPVARLPETDVRARGASLRDTLPLRPDERPVAALPAGEGGPRQGLYVALAAERGWVRRVRSSYLGRSLIPGMSFHDPEQGGPLAAACWTRGEEDLLIVTRQGQGIRFPEVQVRDRTGTLGMRVEQGDRVVAIAGVDEASGLFVATADGKGTIRQMSGFRANKSAGASGKMLIKSDEVAGAVRVDEDDDIFLISALSKIIRFSAAGVPPKEGVVQGVNCMNLRSDSVVAVAAADLER